jgi:azurin
MKYCILLLYLILFCSCNSQEKNRTDELDTQESSESQNSLQVINFKRANIVGLDSNTFAVNENEDHLILGDKINLNGQILYKLHSINVKPSENLFISLTTKNSSSENSISHNFVLLDKSVAGDKFAKASSRAVNYIAPDFRGKIIAKTDIAKNGETVEISFLGPKKSGKYLFLCSLPGHYSNGERGYLIVEQ